MSAVFLSGGLREHAGAYVYDSCLQQEQLDEEVVTVTDIVPVLASACACKQATKPCKCECEGNTCACTCRTCGTMTYQDAVENAENSPCPLPVPVGQWTFESCRSSTTAGTIRDLTIERLCDRPQFARIKGVVDIPIDVLFTDQQCQEWMGRGTISVNKDVLLAIPDESIVPFTLESLVSAICVSGRYIGSCQFEITICITVVLKILAEVELMIPSYGFCEIPPCEEYAENVCDEFFSLPLFPQHACVDIGTTSTCAANGSVAGATATNGCGCASCGCSGSASTCSSCGTTCAGTCSLCPRCGCTMTLSS